MDSVEQFAHDRADSLQWFFAVSHEMLEISLDVWVMLFGAQGWHIKGGTNMTITGLGYARFFVDAFTGIEGSWVKSCKFYPFSMGQVWW